MRDVFASQRPGSNQRSFVNSRATSLDLDQTPPHSSSLSQLDSAQLRHVWPKEVVVVRTNGSETTVFRPSQRVRCQPAQFITYSIIPGRPVDAGVGDCWPLMLVTDGFLLKIRSPRYYDVCKRGQASPMVLSLGGVRRP